MKRRTYSRYRSCLQGYSDTEIAKRLMEMEVPAPCGGQTWYASVVSHMLSNEKMKGDALIQKSDVYRKDAEIGYLLLTEFWLKGINRGCQSDLRCSI